MNTTNTQNKLIKLLEDAVCCFEHPEQECLEEVERIVGWFDVNDEEKKQIIKFFKEEHSDYKWVSNMIKDVFSYVTYNPKLALELSTINL